ncbi:MAG: PQQ-binding-like beta-propeller repeat protein [Planctomycetota bacterium]|nr:PQQ-binding-like beta-propeller repeat protein [Planctomycetota bacterium]
MWRWLLILAWTAAAGAAEEATPALRHSPRPVSLAVFTFANLTGSAAHDWLGTGFAEALTDKLSHVDRLALRNRREVADIARISRIDQRQVDENNAAEIAKLIGADFLIFGAVQAAGPADQPAARLRATARLVETSTGRISRALQVDGQMAGLFELQRRLALDFAALLRLEVSAVAQSAMAHHGTDSLLAYQLYCEGLRLLDEQKYEEAMEKFRAAGAKHPGILYAEAHHALGTAFLRSGRKKEMLAEFKKDTEALSPIWFNLGVAYEKAGQFDKAAEAFQTFVKYTDRRFSPWRYGSGENLELPSDIEGCTHLWLYGRDGYFHCLDMSNGQLCWKKKFPSLAQSIALSGGYAYFGSGGDTVCSVSVLTGEIRWQASAGSAVTSPVQIARQGQVAIVATAAASAVAFEAATGSKAGEKKFDQAVINVQAWGDLVGVSVARDRICALAAQTGEIIWQRATAAPILQAAAVAENILVQTEDGSIRAINAKTGADLWEYSGAHPGTPLAKMGKCCALLRKNGEIALLAEDGRELWRRQPEAKTRHIVCLNNRVIHDEGGLRLAIADSASGRVVEVRVLKEEAVELLGAGRLLLVRLAGGGVQAFDLASGEGLPDDRAGYLRLAEVFERMGKAEAAMDIYRLVLAEIDPACLQAMHALALLYEKQKRDDLAAGMRAQIRTLVATEGEK